MLLRTFFAVGAEENYLTGCNGNVTIKLQLKSFFAAAGLWNMELGAKPGESVTVKPFCG